MSPQTTDRRMRRCSASRSSGSKPAASHPAGRLPRPPGESGGRAGPEAEQLLQEAAWQVLSGSTVEPLRGPAVPRLAHTQGTCTCVHGALQGCRQQREEETTTVPRAAHPHGRAWRRAARRRLRSAADAGLRTVSRRQRASALSQNKGEAQAARARPAGRGLNAPGQSSAQGPLRPCSLASVGVLAQTDVKILQRRSLSRAPPGGRGVGAEARVAACSLGGAPGACVQVAVCRPRSAHAAGARPSPRGTSRARCRPSGTDAPQRRLPGASSQTPRPPTLCWGLRRPPNVGPANAAHLGVGRLQT